MYVRVDQRAIAALPELGDAIRSFEPVPGPAGESVAEWLTQRALNEPQEATVRVRLSHGQVTGVYALCAAQVALGSDERAHLGGVHFRTQPAILLAQIARSAQVSGIGAEMLTHAARTAQEALWYVGATALVVRSLRRSDRSLLAGALGSSSFRAAHAGQSTVATTMDGDPARKLEIRAFGL